MTSLAITLYGQCCRLHVAGQQVVSYISVIRSCRSIYRACSESNSTNLLLRLLMMYLERLFCFNYQAYFALQYGGVYLVTMNTEFSDVTAPCLIEAGYIRVQLRKASAGIAAT